MVSNVQGYKMTNFLIFRKTNRNSMHKYAQGKSDTIWNWLFSFTWFLSPFSNITENMFSISARSTSDVRKIEHICRKNKSTMWSNLVWIRIDFLHTLQIHSMFSIHRVLGSRGFQWCGFHSCAFSKNSTNIQLMQFSLHQWRNSFTHAFWVTNDLSAANLAPVDFCET